jgi:hypothetical protein
MYAYDGYMICANERQGQNGQVLSGARHVPGGAHNKTATLCILIRYPAQSSGLGKLRIPEHIAQMQGPCVWHTAPATHVGHVDTGTVLQETWSSVTQSEAWCNLITLHTYPHWQVPSTTSRSQSPWQWRLSLRACLRW